MVSTTDPIRQARLEVEQEDFRAAVEAEKARIRAKRPWWHRLIPFTFQIKRRSK